MQCKTTRDSRDFRAKHTMEERVAVRHGNSNYQGGKNVFGNNLRLLCTDLRMAADHGIVQCIHNIELLSIASIIFYV